MNNYLSIIYDAIDDLNQSGLAGEDIEKREEENLYGKSGKLDSLSLAHLIVLVEGRIEKECGKQLTLMVPEAYDQDSTPFKTPHEFSQYLEKIISETKDP